MAGSTESTSRVELRRSVPPLRAASATEPVATNPTPSARPAKASHLRCTTLPPFRADRMAPARASKAREVAFGRRLLADGADDRLQGETAVALEDVSLLAEANVPASLRSEARRGWSRP